MRGQTLSHYRVVEKLDAGGMDIIWKAGNTRLDRFGSLEFLPSVKMADPDGKRRFIPIHSPADAA